MQASHSRTIAVPFVRISSRAGGSEGFALIVVLGLMSLALLTVVSLSSLVRSGIATGEINLAEAEARQDARFASFIALGRMQRHLGQDHRVTGEARLLGSAVPEGRLPWTGVWDTSAPDSGPVVWLTSGTDPAAPVNGHEAVLFSESNGNGSAWEVSAPRISIPGARRASENSIAWWISDEATRAALRPARRWSSIPENDWLARSWDAASRARIDQYLPSHNRILVDVGRSEPLTAELPETIRTAQIDDLIGALTRLYQLSEGEIVLLRRHLGRRHFSVRSLGVAANTLPSSDPNRGLRRDLSMAPAPLGPGFEAYLDIVSHMETPVDDPASLMAVAPDSYRPWESDLRRRHRIRPAVAPADANLPSFSVAPVLTDFYLLLGINRASTNDRSRVPAVAARPTSEIVVRYSAHIELWNPYSAALVPEELVVEVTGLPAVTLTTQGGATREIPLQTVLGNGGPDNALRIRLPFEPLGFPSTDDRSWFPGRIYSWLGPNNYSNGNPQTDSQPDQGIFYQKGMTNAIWVSPTGVAYPSPFTTTHGRFGLLTAQPTALTVTLRNQAGDILAVYEDFEFDDFEIASTAIPNQSTAYRFGFRFRLFEAGDVASNHPRARSAWLRTGDPRVARPGLQTIPGLAISEAYFPPNGLDPSSYTSTGVSNADYLLDRVMGGTGKNFMEDIPLFELPRHPPLSMGELQHLRFANNRPNGIGNRWGGDRNRIFDHFMLSGLVENDLAAGGLIERLPNPRLLFLDTSQSPPAGSLPAHIGEGRISRDLLIDGHFNIHSLSSEAWAALLGSLHLEDRTEVNLHGSLNGLGRNRTNLGEMNWNSPYFNRNSFGSFFPRFAQSGQETWQIGFKRLSDGNTGSRVAAQTEFFRQGLNRGTRQQIQALSEAVVERLREAVIEMGRPFMSMEEFLSRGFFPNGSGEDRTVLEQAIADLHEEDADISFNRRTVIDPQIGMDPIQDIWEDVPNFLTQADLVTPFAPVLGLRSDTFVIRVQSRRGEGTADQARLAEMTVQRLPLTIDPTDNPDQPDPDGFGRRFQVTSFRWIDTTSE